MISVAALGHIANNVMAAPVLNPIAVKRAMFARWA
jgi:hypothetical protein